MAPNHSWQNCLTECNEVLYHLEALHKVRHDIFGQFLPPSLLSHFVTHPGTPPKVRHTSRTPRFLEGLVQKTRQKPPCTNSVSIVCGGFCPGVLSGGLLSGRFCLGWFLSLLVLSEYICYIRKLNITLNFMFRMYDNFFHKCDVFLPFPSPCHKLSHLIGPLPLERDVLYGRPLMLT